jgi:hypothetical protein
MSPRGNIVDRGRSGIHGFSLEVRYQVMPRGAGKNHYQIIWPGIHFCDRVHHLVKRASGEHWTILQEETSLLNGQ